MSEDRFFLRPEASTVRLVAYMILVWAHHYGLEVLAIVVLGNHLHVVFRDPRGVHPDWTCMVAHWIARIMNERLGRTGHNFWAPGSGRPLQLVGAKSIARRINYVVTNAVRHGLCARAYEWPGLVFGPEQAGDALVFSRPAELRGSESFPESVRYVVPAPTVPPKHGEWSLWRRATEADESEKRGGRFMGVVRAMSSALFDKPHNVKKSRRHLHFATDDPSLRIALALRRKRFLAAYRKAYLAFKAGDRDVHWPPGTYKMRHQLSLPPPK